MRVCRSLRPFAAMAAVCIFAVCLSPVDARGASLGIGDEAVDKLLDEVDSFGDYSDAKRAKAFQELDQHSRRVVVRRIIARMEEQGDVSGFVLQVLGAYGDYPVARLIDVLRQIKSARERLEETVEEIVSGAAAPPDPAYLVQERRIIAAKALIALGSDSVEPVIELLADKDDLLRAYAAKILAKIDDERTIKPLRKALADPYAPVQWNAAWGLAYKRLPSAAEDLMNLYESAAAAGNTRPDQRDLRIEILRALPRLEGENVTAFLLKALEDPDVSIRGGAVHGLWRRGAADHLDAIAPLIDDGDPGMRSMVAACLAACGDARGASVLIEELDDADQMKRRIAAENLGKIKCTEAVYRLIEALRDKDEEMAHAAAVALGEIGDERAVVPLLAMLRVGNYFAKDGAAIALGKLRCVRAVEPLKELLKEPRGTLTSDAAQSLGEIGDESVWPDLLRLLEDERQWDRSTIREALITLKPDSPEAVEAIAKILLNSDSESDRKHAVYILEAVRSPLAFPALVEAADDENEDIRKRVVWAVRQTDDPERVGILIDFLGKEDKIVHETARAALRDMADGSLVEPLSKALDEGSALTRAGVARVLGQVPGDAALDLLARAVRDVDADVRRRACWALEEQDSPRSAEILLPIVDDPVRDVRRAAAWSLLPHADARYYDTYVAFARHSDPSMRDAGASCLHRIRDRRAIPLLEGMLGDISSGPAAAAALALGMFESPSSVPFLMDKYETKREGAAAMRAYALARIDSPEARAAVEKIAAGRNIDDYRRDYKRYIRGGNREDLAPILMAFARSGDLKMAEDLYWARYSALQVTAEAWAHEHGCYKELIKSDREGRVQWPWPTQGSVSIHAETLRTGTPKEKVTALKRLAGGFERFAPRIGIPMFSDDKIIMKPTFDDPLSPPTHEDSMGWEEWDPGNRANFFKVVGNRAAETLEIKEAFATVRVALDDDDPTVRAAAAKALGYTREPSVIKDILPLRDDEYAGVRANAYSALGMIHTREAADATILGLSDNEGSVRFEAAWALGRQGIKSSVKPVISVLDDPDQWVVHVAIRALVFLEDDDAIEPITGCLDSESVLVRITALKALGEMNAEESLGRIFEMLDDPNGRVKAAAVDALLTIRSEEARTLLAVGVDHANLEMVEQNRIRLIKTGDEGDVLPLIASLILYGGREFSVDLFWSGNETLQQGVMYKMDHNTLDGLTKQMKKHYPDSPDRPRWGSDTEKDGAAAGEVEEAQ